MRNVNPSSTSCIISSNVSFILTMRNVNSLKYTIVNCCCVSFILTMRNVNLTIKLQISNLLKVLY